MNTLSIFICGILFSMIVFPFLQCVGDVFYSYVELIKSKIAIGITKCQVKINELNQEAEVSDTQLIGFETPPETSEFDDCEDDDCDKLNNRKVGF